MSNSTTSSSKIFSRPWVALNRLALSLIFIYRWALSPVLGGKCRFVPTCSRYAEEAFQEYGFFTATTLTLKRIFRCHPWGGYGFDPLVLPKDRHAEPVRSKES